MQIFYINWQQHWEYDWTMNIGANAHGKRTVSTKQHNWKTWQLSFQWYRRGIELVFKSLDCFTMRLFHSATIFFLIHLYLLFGTSPGWLVGWRIFFAGGGGGGGDGGWGAYLDLVGYFDVSNVALVFWPHCVGYINCNVSYITRITSRILFC